MVFQQRRFVYCWAAMKRSFGLPPQISRTAQVADWFAREIRAGYLASGEKLPTEQELIAQFGVSRTVIREAMASLRSEGLVVSRQGSGVFVADQQASTTFRIVSDELHSFTEVQKVMQLRLAVELEAAGIAAEKRSDDDLARMRDCLDAIDASIAAGDSAIEPDFAFHRAIASATGNPYFERFMHFLGPVIIPRQSIRPKAESPEQRRLYLEQVQMEHRRIYQAIERQNVEAARFTLREHLEAGRERYRRMVAGPARS
jgi:GntR family transcriptional regulator, transcriptional repressor for pyruvate dehydrogenase complex